MAQASSLRLNSWLQSKVTTFAEVNDHLPQDIVDSDQIEDITAWLTTWELSFWISSWCRRTLMQEANADEMPEAAAQAPTTVEVKLAVRLTQSHVHAEMGTAYCEGWNR